jgi:hypothetical protein
VHYSQPTLHELGVQFETDKATHHGYTVLYDHWLGHLRSSRVRMLELGILSGASIRMWHAYFNCASKIYAADCTFPEERGFPALDLGPAVELIRADQSNEQDLEAMPRDLDFIIDDGGHRMDQQQLSLCVLFEHLRPGGIYILEDLHTSLPSYAQTHGSTVQNNTLRLLHDLKDKRLSSTNPYYFKSLAFWKLCANIEQIDIVYAKQESITARILKRQ